jgi:hypothetical protein
VPKKLIGINEKGRRIGEDHPLARFSNHDIDLMQRLKDEGVSLRRIAEIMECSVDQVKSVSCGRRRGQYPARFKRVD